MKRFFQQQRPRLAYLHDVLMAALSFPLSLYMRTGAEMVSLSAGYFWSGLVIFTFCAAVVFRYAGLYRGLWRYASLDDLVAIMKAVTLTVLVFLPILFLVTHMQDVPRSLPAINWCVLMILLGGPRFAYRIVKDGRMSGLLREGGGGRRIPVLLIGAGDRAELFIRDCRRDPASPWRPMGLVDADEGRVGRAIHGVPVIGALDDLPRILGARHAALRPERLVLSRTDLDGALVRRILEMADAAGMTLARLPRLSELQSGDGQERTEIRPVAIEDLLGRPQVPLDRAAMRALVAGRRILVTGAGGSIGAELTRQIAGNDPAELILLDAAEHNLYLIDRELSDAHPDVPRQALLGDVRDRARLAEVMRRTAPELVFHAAALKHVPMVESNPAEGVLTNAVGSRIVADACRAARVSCMVLISTDKAVNPSNVMGATKRLAESYIQALDAPSRADGGPRFVIVRFGNVLGSTGSVVPLFQRQLEAGGPLTVTHPEVSRYFMTVREAVELVLQASVLGVAADAPAGGVFVLDMGAPVRILDLARQMIRLAGLREADVGISFSGLRAGEKLHEELLHEGEEPRPAGAPGLTLATARGGDLAALDRGLMQLEELARAGAHRATLEQLGLLVPEYVPETVPETMPETTSDAADATPQGTAPPTR